MTNPDDLSIPDSPEFLDPVALRPYAGEEVPASWRQMAASLRGFYVSLVQQGFTEGQAWDLIRITIKASAERGQDS